MSNFKTALTVLFVVSFLAACKGGSSSNTVADDSGEFARVNDTTITNNEFERYAKAKREAQPDADIDDELITDELIATELLRQEAINEGIADRQDIIDQIKQQETNILINTLMRDKFGSLSFSDEELKQEYDRLIGLSASSEYKARHILLESEDDANAIIESLNGGSDFVELAKNKSTGPSASNGGDLGWFKPETMVPAFAKAVTTMDKGTYTKTPIKTRFGWHVILLEDARDVEKPSFESVKQDVQRSLTRSKIEEYVNGLESNATIVKPSGTAEESSQG